MSWKILKKAENKFIRELKESKPKEVFVGVSGGIDSIVLTHFAVRIIKDLFAGIGITLLHFNHNLRPSSDDDEQLVKNLSKRLGIGFISEKVPKNISETWGSNVENKARLARRAFFIKHIKSTSLLLLGHHLDDDFEWNLLQRLKSSKVGESMYIPYKNGQIIRPFLEVEKRELEIIGETYKFLFTEDDSNSNTKFERNFIRNKVSPLINQRFQNYRQHFLFQKFQICSKLSSDLIDSKTSYHKLGSTLDMSGFGREREDLFKAVARWVSVCLEKYNTENGRGKVSRQVDRIVEAFLNHKKGPLTISGGVYVFVDYPCLHCLKAKSFKISTFINDPIDPKYNDFNRLVLEKGPIFLTNRRPECSPGSAILDISEHEQKFVVTTGYIIKNLKNHKKLNSSLFEVIIEEKSS